MSAIGIVELRGRCAEQAALNERLFEVLGAWTSDTDDAAAQQLFAAACHRHAWHARLWRRRQPAIPVEVEVPDPEALDVTTPPDRRLSAYREVLDRLASAGRELRATSDPALDPGTRRVVALVAADLAELIDRADRLDG